MKRIFSLVIAAIALCSSTQAQNILLTHSNALIDYTKVDSATVKESAELLTKLCDEKIDAIVKASGKQTVANTLTALDELVYELSDLSSKLGLISSTYADDATRNAAFEAADKLSIYISNVYLNEPLYKAIKKFIATKGRTLSPSQKKFLADIMITFEKNGM